MRRVGMRRGTAPIAVSVLLLAGCFEPAPENGTVTGHLRQIGPGVDRPVPGTITISGESVVRQLKAGDDGAYTADLPPGYYSVVGRSQTTGSNEQDCPAAVAAHVESHETTTSDAICAVR